MNHNVGIWIDHRKAVIVFASVDDVTAKTVENHLGRVYIKLGINSRGQLSRALDEPDEPD